ncbi:MAG: hypothetical protein K6C32_04070 [Bacilli bacterium]|nr:hypothetical protein [Bacilli bacterium]
MAKKVNDIKELQRRSGVGLIQAKKALEMFDGNVDNAYDYLVRRGLAKKK